MRKIEAYVSTGFAGAKRHEIIEVEDDCTDDEIEEIVKDWMFEQIEWGWTEQE